MSVKSLILNSIPTKLYLQIQYFKNYRRFLHIRHPRTYADKLAYLKVYNSDPRLTQLVDKYRVRQYVADKIGEEHLIPLLGVYSSVHDIPWEKLPERYVLKCNHDSGSTILHNGGEGFDRELAMKTLTLHLKNNLFNYAREYPYKDVKPLILCERYMDDGHGLTPNDYKIMCFNGEPKYIIVDQNRFVDHHRDVYDAAWNKLDFRTDHPQTDILLEKPAKFDEMLEFARKLSKDFVHVRVDLYLIDDRVYFGELTFCPWGGVIRFDPDEWNYRLGELIEI